MSSSIKTLIFAKLLLPPQQKYYTHLSDGSDSDVLQARMCASSNATNLSGLVFSL